MPVRKSTDANDIIDSSGQDPILRFSARAEDYVAFRPDYPASLVHVLRDRCGLAREWLIADLGAGSGRLTKVFLENGNRVVAIEPNAEMRAVAARELQKFGGSTISDAVAEDTGLADESVDLIVAGSAFHWFDQAAFFRESMRILRPDGWVAIVRLTRRAETDVERAYEALLSKFATDHRRLRAYRVRLEKALVSCGFEAWRELQENRTSFENLLGLSASYSVAPERRDDEFDEFESDLKDLFDRFAEGGHLLIGNDLRVHYCRLRGGLSREALDPAYWNQLADEDEPK